MITPTYIPFKDELHNAMHHARYRELDATTTNRYPPTIGASQQPSTPKTPRCDIAIESTKNPRLSVQPWQHEQSKHPFLVHTAPREYTLILVATMATIGASSDRTPVHDWVKQANRNIRSCKRTE